jgi:LysM repeat protein
MAAAATGANGTAASGSDTNAAGPTYTVKSGDSLTKIAGEFGVSVRNLRSANNLKTDKIVVGQKLKIPGKTGAPASASTTPTSAPATTPTGQ